MNGLVSTASFGVLVKCSRSRFLCNGNWILRVNSGKICIMREK